MIMHYMQAFEAYTRELEQPAAEVDLLKCAALIARATAYPDVEVTDIKKQVRGCKSSSNEMLKSCLPG
jgi:hypothetical protein